MGRSQKGWTVEGGEEIAGTHLLERAGWEAIGSRAG